MALITAAGRNRVGVGQVSVAWAETTPESTDGTDGTDAPLSDQDLARVANFGPERRQAFLRGRALIASLVVELFADASGWSLGSRPCPRCGVRHSGVEVTGVPVVAGVSYAPGLVVAAVAPRRRVGRLGIDVELDASDATRSRDLQRLLGPSRVPPLRRWTRIEAILKADGRGLLVDPADVAVLAGRGRIADDPARYRVSDVAGPAGYLVSLAWCGAAAWAARSGSASA